MPRIPSKRLTARLRRNCCEEAAIDLDQHVRAIADIVIRVRERQQRTERRRTR
jgi:hypothetical protein